MIEGWDRLGRTPERELALDCLEVGLEAGDPERVLLDAVTSDGETLVIGTDRYDLGDYEEVIVLGGGKAAGRQARAIESLLDGRIDGGLVVTTDPRDTERIEVRLGDHPVPSERAVEATRSLLELARSASEDTLVIVLISGGGSALLPAPVDGVSLADLQRVTTALLESGATIHEINAVRKHLSVIKGGGLAATAAPATVVTLVMSDVVGDDPSVIASGPTVPDESTFEDALAVLDRYAIDTPEGVASHLRAGVDGHIAESPGPGETVFEHVDTHLVADSATPMRAARGIVEARGLTPLLLSARIRGEAREAAKSHVAIGEQILATGDPVAPPAVVLSGGETTVTLRGDGTGGPNQEFALSAALEIDTGITLAAIDTDGVDGTGPAAGGIVDAETVEDPAAAQRALARNDAYPYLRARDDAIETGTTGTNLNDFRVVVIDPASERSR